LFILFVRLKWKEGTVHTAPSVVLPYLSGRVSLAFGQARQMDTKRPVNLSSASRPNQNYESLSFIVAASISVAQLLGSFIAFCYIARSDHLTISTQRLRPNFKQ